jgi:pyridoxine 4-dehydrogenase
MVEAEVSLSATDFFSNGAAEVCAGLGIMVLAHTLLSRGMLTGNIQKPEDMPASNHHKHPPPPLLKKLIPSVCLNCVLVCIYRRVD